MDVYCKTCMKPYPKMHSDDQGIHCASYVTINALGDRYIFSQYGSEHEGDEFFVSPKSTIKPGVICDPCMASELALRHIIINEHTWTFITEQILSNMDNSEE